ncbi:MAG: mechanosensitive ion channel domain-containing protein [Leeuwenhoekiella sp.]
MQHHFFQISFDTDTTKFLLLAIGVAAVLFFALMLLFKKLGKSPRNILPLDLAKRIRIPLALLFTGLLLRLDLIARVLDGFIDKPTLHHLSNVLIIASFTWFAVMAVRIFKAHVLGKYDISTEDNLKARKVYTQMSILERVIIFLIILFGVSITLMSFPSVRQIGTSMLASAGVAGIIIGFAAQKALGTLLAGIQIAFTQPIRIDDVVIAEGEWGRIEEITLTFVVVNIWDKRRLVLPTTYFIEQPFQNWTRNSSDILGTVFIYTDYNVPFDALRKELTRLLESTPLWDGKVNVLQVTEAKENTVESRALMSAEDSPTAWDLRVFVREKLIVYIQENYPESLPRTRVEMLELGKRPKSSSFKEDTANQSAAGKTFPVPKSQVQDDTKTDS